MSSLFLDYKFWPGPLVSNDTDVVFTGMVQKDVIWVELADHSQHTDITVVELWKSTTSVPGTVTQNCFDFVLDQYIPSLPFVCGASTVRYEFCRTEKEAANIALKFSRNRLDLDVTLSTPTVVNEGRCPKCGHLGEFRQMALCCPVHGAYAGI